MLVNFIAKFYQRSLTSKLAPLGLRYEDLLIETVDVKKAVSQLPMEEQVARDRRIKLAYDLSLKRKELPEALQPKQDCFSPYLFHRVAQLKAEREEREKINSF